jgi:DNA-binding MarR family transcriptional regulator
MKSEKGLMALSTVQCAIIRFVRTREKAVRADGLEPLQFQFLTLVEPFHSNGQQPNISAVASQLGMQHHSAVELVDRLVERGLLRRKRANHDRRHVLLGVTLEGKKLLRRAILQEYADVHEFAPVLERDLKVFLNGVRPRASSQRSRKGGIGGRSPAARMRSYRRRVI